LEADIKEWMVESVQAANLIINSYAAQQKINATAAHFISDFQDLLRLGREKKVSKTAMNIVFDEMLATGESPAAIVKKKGLAQVSDTSAIEKFCDDAIAANPGPVADFKAGKAAALNFLKGQVMKLSEGKANPALAGEILEQKLRG
jgi:aspartyl-tRNA(Asn)/glutamyl-tRNA(Gln) amidotransferase subunit B